MSLLADSSTWIDYTKGVISKQTDLLDAALAQREVMIGGLIITEVLQGVREDAKYEFIRGVLMSLRYVHLSTKPLAVLAAQNYRALRKQGITIRSPIDMIIATWCIKNDFPLLHSDRDFDFIEGFLPLQVIR